MRGSGIGLAYPLLSTLLMSSFAILLSLIGEKMGAAVQKTEPQIEGHQMVYSQVIASVQIGYILYGI